MKILAVDTALGACSAAVLDGSVVLAHRFELMDRGHAEALAPMVRDAMRQAALDFGELERLAVTTGPGTFTGQRVGLAFMRGLRIALQLPLIGITTLHAMAAAAIAETGAQLAAALHDAKRGEVYFALHLARETLIEPTLLPLDGAVDVIMRRAAGRTGAVAFAGSAAISAYERYRALGGHADLSSVTQPDAVWVGRFAIGAQEPDRPPRPLYLRPPDARLPIRGP